MARMLSIPQAVVQRSEWWCWAACLEIMNRAIGPRFYSPILTQDQWVGFLRASPAAGLVMNAQDGIRVGHMPSVLGQFGMRLHSWAGPPAPVRIPPGGHDPVVDISKPEGYLQHGHLLAGRPVPGGSHFVVIYGVDATRVHYFDPAPGRGVQSVTHENIRSGRLLVAWKP